MDTSNVDTVFIGGKLRKSKGKLVGVDLTGSAAWLISRETILFAKRLATTALGLLPGHWTMIVPIRPHAIVHLSSATSARRIVGASNWMSIASPRR